MRLKQHYPELIEKAKAYEKPNRVKGQIFYWTDEPLADLEKPERMAAIEENWERSQARKKARRSNRSLVDVLAGLESEAPPRAGCMICQL